LYTATYPIALPAGTVTRTDTHWSLAVAMLLAQRVAVLPSITLDAA